MRFLSADFTYPINSPVIPNGIVAVRNDGSIDGVYAAGQLSENLTIEKHKGILCPGFVNAHCHLELSYLKGKIDKHTSLTGFISGLLKERNTLESESIIQVAAAEADEYMFKSGINAVGDISNDSFTFEIKSRSSITYHTFIELYDFLEVRTVDVFAKGEKLIQPFPMLRKSLTPHATYSVTQSLLKKILSANIQWPVSIHHDETGSEKDLLKSGTGKLAGFFQKFFGNDYWVKENITTAYGLAERMHNEQPLILVHNTYTTAETVEQIKKTDKKIFWCFCPKANLYIENRLPDFSIFHFQDNCCLGTDSLASNDTLCILEEIKTILRFYPEISTEKLLKWATLNGSGALMMENQLGSLEKNKKPGVVLIEKTEGEKITQESRVKRLV